GDWAERDEDPIRRGGDEAGEGGLAAPRWAPEDHRPWGFPLDGIPKRLARPEQVLLPDELVECRRSHPGRQRAGLAPSGKERVLPYEGALARHRDQWREGLAGTGVARRATRTPTDHMPTIIRSPRPPHASPLQCLATQRL